MLTCSLSIPDIYAILFHRAFCFIIAYISTIRQTGVPFGTRRFSRICAETCTGHGCCSIRPVQVFPLGFPSTDGHSWHVLVALPTIAYCPRIPSLYTQLSGTLCSLSGLLPLFRDIVLESASQLIILFLHRCFHAHNSKVTQSAPNIGTHVLHHNSNIFALTVGS